MLDVWTKPAITSVHAQQRRARLTGVFWALCMLGFVGMVGLAVARNGPNAVIIAWLIFLGVLGAIFYNPRYGLYIILALTLINDQRLAYWYPFVKNLSSWESIFYLHDAIIFSPLELCIVLMFISWLSRPLLMRQKFAPSLGPLFWPVAVFVGFVAVGLGYGMANGANLTIALWEIRAIFYLPALLLLTTNLIETRSQVVTLIWVAALAIFAKALMGAWYVANTLNFAVGGVDRIAEHVMSIHLNSLIVLAIAALLFRARPARRIVLPLMLPVVLLSYLANNRRASFIALGIALVLLLVVLFYQNRRLFWLITPPFIILSLVYLAVFWNAEGPLALPANAVRSVVGGADERDASSNYYRYLENLNIMFTIKTSPLTGVGFGNKFHIIASMADISFFVFWEYITHNSILWIWMKSGLAGFLALMFMVGWTLMMGGRTIRLMPDGELRTIAVSATLYILMHFVFSYVDMSWDAMSMVYMGAMMGLINILPAIAARPLPARKRRWPWQGEASSAV